jgi:hypothetical protein
MLDGLRSSSDQQKTIPADDEAHHKDELTFGQIVSKQLKRRADPLFAYQHPDGRLDRLRALLRATAAGGPPDTHPGVTREGHQMLLGHLAFLQDVLACAGITLDGGIKLLFLNPNAPSMAKP